MNVSNFRDVSHEPLPNSRGPPGSIQTNNAGIGAITVCRSSRSRLLLQHAQQLRLQDQGDIAYFVQKQGALISHFEASDLLQQSHR
jgi:hypothetical protein